MPTGSRPTHYAIKAVIADPDADGFAFPAHKTMYGGRRIAAGDTVFVFASETQGGIGLIARGVVTEAEPDPPIPGLARQAPRVSLVVRRMTRPALPMGRAQLRHIRTWGDGRPETEIAFKLYRESSNKLVGLSESAARFLDARFPQPPAGS